MILLVSFIFFVCAFLGLLTLLCIHVELEVSYTLVSEAGLLVSEANKKSRSSSYGTFNLFCIEL